MPVEALPPKPTTLQRKRQEAQSDIFPEFYAKNTIWSRCLARSITQARDDNARRRAHLIKPNLGEEAKK
jgi:hypothetical protein